MTPEIVPFSRFIKSLNEKKQSVINRSQNFNTASNKELRDVREYLIGYYNGMTAISSFKDPDGQVWDCIPVEQQPSLRNNLVAAKPPAISKVTDNRSFPKTRNSLLSLKRKDDQGNNISCPKGYIPFRRIDIQQMATFATLENYFKKIPGEKKRLPSRKKSKTSLLGISHKYANAFQQVNNIGGQSILSIWQPSIPSGCEFSLSQQWYAARNTPLTQTIEAGWHVYPRKYGNSPLCRLFIYWTADNYQTTGAYNLEKSGFVQVSNKWALGGAFPQVSRRGGKQVEMQLTWQFYQGNWWLFIDGANSASAVGYYPASLFNNGPLSRYATEINFGGEVVGTSGWSEMGSGAFAAQGSLNAAYQRNIIYYDTQRQTRAADLISSQPSPGCYTISVNNTPTGGHFYFGGPGGNNC